MTIAGPPATTRSAIRCAELFVVAAVAALAADAGGAPAEKPLEEQFETIRDVPDPAAAVQRLVAAARKRGAESVAVVLDRVTFDPPPGENEFTAGDSLVPHRGVWLDATVAAAGAPGSLPMRIATTTSKEVRDATPRSAAAVAAECDGSVWKGDGRELVSAQEWIDAFGAALPGKRRAIVLVTGNVLSESWVSLPFDASKPRTREPWRSALGPEGTYWREEELAVVARRRGVTLFLVAPEAKFGDEVPRTDIPMAPFASRPRVRPPTTPEAWVAKPRARKPDDAARAAMTDEMRRRGLDDASIAMALAAKVRDAGEILDPLASGRFGSSLPVWFPMWGDAAPWTTDCPSGHGWWRYVRAAAATGGAFVTYPFPRGPSKWMDVCPREDSLVEALAPPLVPKKDSDEAATRDDALAAMLQAQGVVLDVTPWTDHSHGYNTRLGGLWGWCGFELPGPSPHRRWEPRRMPIDQEHDFYDPARTAAAADRAAKAYPRAIKILAAAASDPRVTRAPRRSQANLRLCRFWFETSLFHLQALGLASRDPVAFGAKDARAEEHYLATWNAVRLSDGLPAYDGRVLTAWDESWYGERWTRAAKGEPYQGAFLAIPAADPNFRALRDTDRVLANLAPQLRPQALAVLAAARDVMSHEARTPWGWTVYYSMLHTYAWSPPNPDPVAAEGGDRRPAPSSSGGATTPK